MGAPLASCCCQWAGGGGLVNKNRSMSIDLEDASDRGFDHTRSRSSPVSSTSSLSRGLFLFLDQGHVPTLSHQSPSPMVPRRQTPPTSFARPATCDAAHLVSRRRATADQSFSQLGLPRVAKAREHTPRAGSPSPAGRVTASPESPASSGGPVVREGGRERRDLALSSPSTGWLVKDGNQKGLSGPESVVDLLLPSSPRSLAHPLTGDPWLDFAGQKASSIHPPPARRFRKIRLSFSFSSFFLRLLFVSSELWETARNSDSDPHHKPRPLTVPPSPAASRSPAADQTRPRARTRTSRAGRDKEAAGEGGGTVKSLELVLVAGSSQSKGVHKGPEK